MNVKTKQAILSLPLTALKCLYKSARGKSIVCEIDISSIKKVNEANTIDEMVAEARLEHFLGKTKGFKNSDKLMEYLEN